MHEETRMTTTRWIAPLTALLLAAATLAGCETQGPFEEAGEEIDEAIDDAEDFLDRRD